MRIQDVTDDLAEGLGLEEARGALVTDVPEGPAMEAGMEAGDVILSFDGTEVEDTRGLVRKVGETPVGKEVRVLIFREGETETLLVTLGRREDAERAVPASVNTDEPITNELHGADRQQHDGRAAPTTWLPDDAEGLVVADVAEDSEAYEEGLARGRSDRRSGAGKGVQRRRIEHPRRRSERGGTQIDRPA